MIERVRSEQYTILDLRVSKAMLSVTSLNVGKATNGHKHPWMEGYYFSSGYGELKLGDELLRVGEGDLIIIPPDTFHQVYNLSKVAMVFVCVWEANRVICVAGKFDPIHCGHLDHIRKAKALGDRLIAITHPDEILIKKKGYCLMPLADRVEILESIRWVDEVVVSIDSDGTVAKTLEKVRQETEGELVFAKGGDRTSSTMPENEIETCERLGIKIIYGVGNKPVHSQELVLRLLEQLEKKK